MQAGFAADLLGTSDHRLHISSPQRYHRDCSALPRCVLGGSHVARFLVYFFKLLLISNPFFNPHLHVSQLHHHPAPTAA